MKDVMNYLTRDEEFALRQVALAHACATHGGFVGRDGEAKETVITRAAAEYLCFLLSGDVAGGKLREAAIIFRCPEGFNAFFDALGWSDSPDLRAEIDGAFKRVANDASRKGKSAGEQV